MKKILFGILVLAASLCSASTAGAYSYETFTKHPLNPLTVSKSYEGWNEVTPIQHFVLKESSKYSLWYTSYDLAHLKLGYADSQDGITFGNGQLIQIAENGDIHDPAVLKDQGKTYLYYALDSNGGTIFRRAETLDNIHYLSPTTLTLPRQSWNSRELSCPYVYLRDGVYTLFYCGHDGTHWSLGMATSTDGVHFTPCANNPLFPDEGNSFLMQKNDSLYLYMHSTTAQGIKLAQATGQLGCTTVWTDPEVILHKDTPYDSMHMSAPSLIEEANELRLYYSGRNSNGIWTLDLATSVDPVTPHKAYVIVPGFFGSWNRNAVLHNLPVSPGQWKLAPFVTEYNGLVETFRNLGFIENKDFYIFAYDWRKGAEENAEALKNYLEAHIWTLSESTQVNLIGHSYGGLIARIYAQKYGVVNLSKLITVGTPHKGVVQAYKPVSAGELDRMDDLMWLSSKLILTLYSAGHLSDKTTLALYFPALRDLLPRFNFLKTARGSFIDVNTMNVQNELLKKFEDVSSSLTDIMVSVSGQKDLRTPTGYIVERVGFINVLFGNYLDGVPIKTLLSGGDYLVSALSSVFGVQNIVMPLDHTELITSRSGVKKILELLQIPTDDSQIVVGSKTIVSPSLLITIQSPVDLEVVHENQTFQEQDGVIFIPNAQSGEYKIILKGREKGAYTLTVAQVSKTNDVWEKVKGKIESSDPQTEVDEFEIKFNSKKSSQQLTRKSVCSKPRHLKNWKDFRKLLKCRLEKVKSSAR